MIRQIEDITYMNCGDWVDSCSAIVEHLDGRMELVRQGDSLPLEVAPLRPMMDRPREAANT